MEHKIVDQTCGADKGSDGHQCLCLFWDSFDRLKRIGIDDLKVVEHDSRLAGTKTSLAEEISFAAILSPA